MGAPSARALFAAGPLPADRAAELALAHPRFFALLAAHGTEFVRALLPPPPPRPPPRMRLILLRPRASVQLPASSASEGAAPSSAVEVSIRSMIPESCDMVGAGLRGCGEMEMEMATPHPARACLLRRGRTGAALAATAPLAHRRGREGDLHPRVHVQPRDDAVDVPRKRACVSCGSGRCGSSSAPGRPVCAVVCLLRPCSHCLPPLLLRLRRRPPQGQFPFSLDEDAKSLAAYGVTNGSTISIEESG